MNSHELVLQASGFYFAYASWDKQSTIPLFQNLDLHLTPGECLGVMGASGTGKTTLCHIANGLLSRLGEHHQSGSLVVLGHDVAKLKPEILAGRIGATFQEIEHQLFNATVENEIAWTLEAIGTPREEIIDRIRWSLDVVGLDVDLDRAPYALSGGQQRRLALAVALAIKPELIILDEPIGGLDPAGKLEVATALDNLKQETGAAILLTESDAETVLTLADRLIVLSEGKAAMEGEPAVMFTQVPRMVDNEVQPPQMNRIVHNLKDYLPTPIADSNALIQSLQDLKIPTRGLEPETRDTETHYGDDPILEIDQVRYQYADGPLVLHDTSLVVPRGQFLALVGSNGSGKTTLVKHIIGLLRPSAGCIRINGDDIVDRRVPELARQVGFLFQQPERQIFAESVRSELEFGPRNLGLDRISQRVENALTQFDLQDVADSPPSVLSYAQQRRVTLASLAVMDQDLLVLDEPTVGLDRNGMKTTLEWCQSLQRQGKTTVLVTHDMEVAAMADRVVVLESGKVVGDGAPAAVFAADQIMHRSQLNAPLAAKIAQQLNLPHIATIDALCDVLIPVLKTAA